MKSIRFFCTAAALTVGLTLSSCDKKLDIQPVNQIDTRQALATSADVEALLVGAYGANSGLGSVDLYGGNLQRDAELLGDNGGVVWDGTFTAPGEVYDKKILVNNDQASETWLDGYYTINICNLVLANLTLVDQARRIKVEAEAKFIRASVYFELVRTYAKTWSDGDNAINPGVPLVLMPTTVITSQNTVARNSVAEVYAQILTDLLDAEVKMPATNSIFAAKGAVSAQLSRVYLQQRNYPQAALAANRVITSGKYQLAASPEEAFDLRLSQPGVDTPETIFSLKVTDQDGTNNLNTFYGSSDYGGRGDIFITDAQLNSYTSDDLRGQLFYDDQTAGVVRTAKFVNQYGNIQVFRLAEMYLTRAEANFLAGTTTGATPLADVNLIRVRAGLTALTPAQLNITAIRRERRLELAFEGTLIHDLKRYRQSVGSLPYNSPRLIFPIPQRERDANSLLVQNEGY